MGCVNKLPLCKIHNCAACEYEGNESLCPYHASKSEADRDPTFAWMLANYETHCKAGMGRKDGVHGIISGDLAAVGLTLESKASEMTRSVFKHLLTTFKDPHRVNGPLADHSIASHLNAFRAITSDDLEDFFADDGFDLPVFSIPRFHVEKKPVQEVSDETARKVEIWMERCLASGTQKGRNEFVYTFFGMYCGMSAIDICLGTWGIIKQTPMGIMLEYKRHKTGKVVSQLINHKAYCKIAPLMGAPDEPIIPLLANRTGKHTQKAEGRYSGMHRWLRSCVNRALRLLGIDGGDKKRKAFHALRKYFETGRALEVGIVQAARETGNSPRTAGQYYVGSLSGKLARAA